MKTTLFLISAVILIFFPGQQITAGEDSVRMYFNSLGCVFCAKLIEAEFTDFEGISEFEFDGEQATVSFTIAAEHNITLETIEERVLKARFRLKNASITRSNGLIEYFEREHTAVE